MRVTAHSKNSKFRNATSTSSRIRFTFPFSIFTSIVRMYPPSSHIRPSPNRTAGCSVALRPPALPSHIAGQHRERGNKKPMRSYHKRRHDPSDTTDTGRLQHPSSACQTDKRMTDKPKHTAHGAQAGTDAQRKVIGRVVQPLHQRKQCHRQTTTTPDCRLHT